MIILKIIILRKNNKYNLNNFIISLIFKNEDEIKSFV